MPAIDCKCLLLFLFSLHVSLIHQRLLNKFLSVKLWLAAPWEVCLNCGWNDKGYNTDGCFHVHTTDCASLFDVVITNSQPKYSPAEISHSFRGNIGHFNEPLIAWFVQQWLHRPSVCEGPDVDLLWSWPKLICKLYEFISLFFWRGEPGLKWIKMP